LKLRIEQTIDRASGGRVVVVVIIVTAIAIYQRCVCAVFFCVARFLYGHLNWIFHCKLSGGGGDFGGLVFFQWYVFVVEGNHFLLFSRLVLNF